MEMQDSPAYLLGRIEGKVDMLLKSREEDLANNKLTEGRIVALERFRWTLFGGMTAASAAVTGFLNLVVWHK